MPAHSGWTLPKTGPKCVPTVRTFPIWAGLRPGSGPFRTPPVLAGGTQMANSHTGCGKVRRLIPSLFHFQEEKRCPLGCGCGWFCVSSSIPVLGILFVFVVLEGRAEFREFPVKPGDYRFSRYEFLGQFQVGHAWGVGIWSHWVVVGERVLLRFVRKSYPGRRVPYFTPFVMSL